MSVDERLAQAEGDRALCEQMLDDWNQHILRLEAALRYYAEGHIWDHGEIAREALGVPRFHEGGIVSPERVSRFLDGLGHGS